MSEINIDNMTLAEQDALLRQLKSRRDGERKAVREAYEGLKAGFVAEVRDRVHFEHGGVSSFKKWLMDEVEGFRAIMAEYGEIGTKQMSFTVAGDNFKMAVKTNKVKKFDERADMAAQRLIIFLKEWIRGQKEGTENPMYQLAMLSIERNSKGDLDYKRVSDLYKLETGFNSPEYTAIMELLRESHIVEGTATHYYFWKKDEHGVWRKIEISFNML